MQQSVKSLALRIQSLQISPTETGITGRGFVGEYKSSCARPILIDFFQLMIKE